MEEKQEDMKDSDFRQESQSSENAESASQNCPKCKRLISQKSGQCYYCGEADTEAVKQLNMIMLEWKYQEAKDPRQRASQKAITILSVLFAMTSAVLISTYFLPEMDIGIPFWLFGILSFGSGLLGWCFHFNSLNLIIATFYQAGMIIFGTSLAIKCVPDYFSGAFLFGLLTALSICSVILITLRIFSNKAIEL
jgi:hypothetical protein